MIGELVLECLEALTAGTGGLFGRDDGDVAMAQVHEVSNHLPHGIIVLEQNTVARDFHIPIQQNHRYRRLRNRIVHERAGFIAGLYQQPIDAALTLRLD